MGNDHLRKYVQYIHNTGQSLLPIDAFDDDWEPIGPSVRRDLVAAGLIIETNGRVALHDKGIALL